MPDRCIGERDLTDGSTRSVFADERGQYVLDDQGERVYGFWLPLDLDDADEPVIVSGQK